MFPHMNLIFVLGMAAPLILLCLIFLVVGLASHKEDEAKEANPRDSVDSPPRRSSF